MRSNDRLSKYTRLALALSLLMILTCGCQAVTPGPVTTRNMTDTAAVQIEETSEAAVEETVEEAAEEETSSEVSDEVSEGTWMVAAADINVRSGPSTDDEVIGALFEGDEVLQIGTDGNWAKIQFEDGEGYASLNYLKQKE